MPTRGIAVFYFQAHRLMRVQQNTVCIYIYAQRSNIIVYRIVLYVAYLRPRLLCQRLELQRDCQKGSVCLWVVSSSPLPGVFGFVISTAHIGHLKKAESEDGDLPQASGTVSPSGENPSGSNSNQLQPVNQL